MAADILSFKGNLAEAQVASQPDVMHLRTLNTDPAVAKEFSMIRDDNRRLQKENVSLKSQIDSLQFKPTDQVRNLTASPACIECPWKVTMLERNICSCCVRLSLSKRRKGSSMAASLYDILHVTSVCVSCSAAEHS